MEAGDVAESADSKIDEEQQQPITLKELRNAGIPIAGYIDDMEEDRPDKYTLAMKMYERIKELSRDELSEEAANDEGGEFPVLHYAAAMKGISHWMLLLSCVMLSALTIRTVTEIQ
jgi:hypothetical protein